MFKYGKPVWGLMKEAATQIPQPFRRKDIIQWFLSNHPGVPRSTVTSHIVSCCVNDPNRHHHNIHSNKDILWKLPNGLYEKYNPNKHSAFSSQGNPVTPAQHPVPTDMPNRSRHDEFIALFNGLGRSLGHSTQPTQAPFRHDVVWRKGRREPFIVVEVCDGGSLDKDLASLQWAVNPENWGASAILVLDEKDKQRALSRLGASKHIFVIPFDTGEDLCKLIQSYSDLIGLVLQR